MIFCMAVLLLGLLALMALKKCLKRLARRSGADAQDRTDSDDMGNYAGRSSFEKEGLPAPHQENLGIWVIKESWLCLHGLS